MFRYDHRFHMPEQPAPPTPQKTLAPEKPTMPAPNWLNFSDVVVKNSQSNDTLLYVGIGGVLATALLYKMIR